MTKAVDKAELAKRLGQRPRLIFRPELVAAEPRAATS